MITNFKLYEEINSKKILNKISNFFDKTEGKFSSVTFTHNVDQYKNILNYLIKNGYRWSNRMSPEEIFHYTDEAYDDNQSLCILLNNISRTIKVVESYHYLKNMKIPRLLIGADEILRGKLDSRKIIKERERNREKFKHIDPYGEDDWDEKKYY